ncbi:MAG: HlyD family efflux transporter periplasmic adaptor subunit [Bacteroidota bacterium]
MTKYLIAAGILVACIGGAALMIALRPEPPQEPPPERTPLVQTSSADVRSGTLQVTGNGTVRPRAEIGLAPQIAGQVVYVNPALVSGARVRRGQVLVRIDPADYQNRVQQAEADVAQQQVNVLQAEEEAAIARAEYEQFRRRDARQGAATFGSVDSNDYARRFVGEERQAQARTTDEPSALVLREPQLQAAQASLARAQAALADAQLALDRTQIVAPFDGVVRSETVDPGAYVAPGQVLAQIYASDAVEVSVPLSDEDAALIPTLWAPGGQRIAARVVGTYGAQEFAWDGYVDRAETALDTESRTIDVIVRVPQPFSSGQRVTGPGGELAGASVALGGTPPLLVGQFVDIDIDGASLERYTVVPRQALRPGDEVWAVESDSLVTIVPVQVLQQTGEEVAVLGDLREGQPVIISNLQVVTNGMKVRLADTGADRPRAPADSTALAARP